MADPGWANECWRCGARWAPDGTPWHREWCRVNGVGVTVPVELLMALDRDADRMLRRLGVGVGVGDGG